MKSILLVTGAATLASAASVTFVSQDNLGRTVNFTRNPGIATPGPVHVPAGGRVRVEFQHNWEGNGFAVVDGRPVKPGMLMEVSFNQGGGITYFDVSAIVDPNDHDGVHLMYPAGSGTPNSGGVIFPCDNAYYQPDDRQTKATYEQDLIVTLHTNRGPGR
ncbi:DNase1 protein [Canariomyces notabilis]|uniref:DNase1 protein n=1 Tax=Canariomyces notabilis TaxID=2074819 RepID=A0AAN6QR21_9PEZI|nr:DNase1 protein [Canariomyces arenarius]